VIWLRRNNSCYNSSDAASCEFLTVARRMRYFSGNRIIGF